LILKFVLTIKIFH